jgi:CRP-like cAMP-binding protein
VSTSFNLRDERIRVEGLWRHGGVYFPLSVAAAIAFHRVHDDTRAVESRRDYEEALDLAARTLSRLIPIYVTRDPRMEREIAIVDPATEFTGGATRLRRSDGTLLTGLSVLRSDLLCALDRLSGGALPLLAGRPDSARDASAALLVPSANRILGALPGEDYARLAQYLDLVTLAGQKVLYRENEEQRYLYFPVSGTVCLVQTSREGVPTELAVVGNDGVIGVSHLLGGATAPRRAVVQVAGQAYRMEARRGAGEFRRGGAFQKVVLLYVQVLLCQVAQTAVCNRQHTAEQQLCRWLLLGLDHVHSNEIVPAQDCIGHALGSRGPGIAEAAHALQRAGVIDHSRGRIVVLDRAELAARACECYYVVRQEADRLLPAGREERDEAPALWLTPRGAGAATPEGRRSARPA